MGHTIAERYVLLWTADGKPKAVHPVRNLWQAQNRLKELLARDGSGWFLFDTQAEKLIEPEAAFVMAS